MIGGFMLGAWMSGRAAGRSSGRRQATAGFVCSGIAVGGNVLYTLLVTEQAMTLAVLPVALNAFGNALVNPIATLAILAMYPQLRGQASSLLAFDRKSTRMN